MLKINIFNLSEYEQFKILFEKHKIFPLKYRQLFHFLSFLYKLIIRKNSKIVNKFLNSLAATRTPYRLPDIHSDFKKYSFTSISTKILNRFMHKFITVTEKEEEKDETVTDKQETDAKEEKENNNVKLAVKKFLINKINEDFIELYSYVT